MVLGFKMVTYTLKETFLILNNWSILLIQGAHVKLQFTSLQLLIFLTLNVDLLSNLKLYKLISVFLVVISLSETHMELQEEIIVY